MDRFNREITITTEEIDGQTVTSYCVTNVCVQAQSLEQALNTLNAMAPERWVEPVE